MVSIFESCVCIFLSAAEVSVAKSATLEAAREARSSASMWLDDKEGSAASTTTLTVGIVLSMGCVQSSAYAAVHHGNHFTFGTESLGNSNLILTLP